MIRFAERANGQQPVPSAASELTSGAEQAQAAPPVEKTPPVKTIPTAVASPPLESAEVKKETPPVEPPVAVREPHVSGHGVVVAANRVGVPSFVGEPLRVAIESASTAGLALQIVGSGIAREQVPAPGSMVPPGTEIVVRFTR